MERNIWNDPISDPDLDEAEVPLWFWNDKLETDELIRQLKMKTDIGVKCTNPHARTNNGDGFIGGYLNDEWFNNIGTVVSYKKKHNESMWLYDEIDWPAGSCGQSITKDENNREQYITIEKHIIPAGEAFRSQLLTFEGIGLFGITNETDQSNFAYNIAIINKETYKPYDLRNYMVYDIFGPELEFSDKNDAVAFIISVHTDSYFHDGNEQVNYLDANVTHQFLASTYDKYYEHFGSSFGSTIRCIFDDETRMCHAIPWSNGFAQAFKQKKGYDIRQTIYQLIITADAPCEAWRTRLDYYDVMASLYQENYFGELHKWCEAHNIKLFAHLLGEETLFGHARYSGDYLRQSKYQDVCGVDHLGKGIGSLNIKFSSCGAHSYGKTRTAVEVFAGCGWDLTFGEYTRIITWMFQQGMQTIINHGFFYSDRGNRKNDWPPSQFFQWQGWPHMKEGNEMIRRLQYAMTDGINEPDILIYHPMETYLKYYIPNQHYTHAFINGPFERDSNAARIDTTEQLLLNAIESANMDFDLIHNDAIENFCVDSSFIRNDKNGQKFSVLLLPECEVLPVSMAILCDEFAQKGGRIVIVGKVPAFGAKQADDKKVSSVFDALVSEGKAKVLSSDDIDKIIAYLNCCVEHPVRIVDGTSQNVNLHPTYPPLLIDPYIHGGEDIRGVRFVRYLKQNERHILFMNYDSAYVEIEANIESESVPVIWDTLSGEILPADLLDKGTLEDGKAFYRIRLLLPPDHGIIVTADINANN